MGKNLKGKEIGKGLYQRKDGLSSAQHHDGERMVCLARPTPPGPSKPV